MRKKYKNICFGLHGSLAGEIWQAHLTLHHHHGTRPEDTRGCHCQPECVSAVLSLYFFGLWSGISFLFNSIFTRVSEVWKYGPRFFSELDIWLQKSCFQNLGFVSSFSSENLQKGKFYCPIIHGQLYPAGESYYLTVVDPLYLQICPEA
jgi:hypothetical protein